MVGLKNFTYAKISPKMVNPRNIAGEHRRNIWKGKGRDMATGMSSKIHRSGGEASNDQEGCLALTRNHIHVLRLWTSSFYHKKTDKGNKNQAGGTFSHQLSDEKYFLSNGENHWNQSALKQYFSNFELLEPLLYRNPRMFALGTSIKGENSSICRDVFIFLFIMSNFDTWVFIYLGRCEVVW